MSASRRRLAAAATLLLFALRIDLVAAFGTYEVGGPGGAPFADQCRGGDVLVGLTFTAGKDLNTIAAICQRATTEGAIVGEPYTLQTRGTHPNRPYGVQDDVRCPGGAAIQSVSVGVSRHNTVHDFTITCRNMATGAWLPDSASSFTAGGEAVRVQVAPCGSGTIATGIIGGHGALIDRLGLVCTAYQEPQVPQPTPIPASKPPPRDAPLPVGGGGVDGGNAGGATGRANTDTTVYDQPGGSDVAYLSVGDPVFIVQCGQPENWCQISAPAAGWVWGPELDR